MESFLKNRPVLSSVSPAKTFKNPFEKGLVEAGEDQNALIDVPLAQDVKDDEKEGPRPSVKMAMNHGQVSRIVVKCSCGECIDLSCN